MRQIDARWLQCRASRNDQAKTKVALRVSPLFVESVQEVGFVIGRPKKILDTKRIAALRGKTVGWKRIATEPGVGVGTIYRIALEGSKTPEKVF